MDQDRVVKTTALSKIFPTGRTAVCQVSLSVSPGEIYGVVGHNGAGKTTFLRMLVGLLTPTSGHISILGHAPGSEQGLAGVGSMIEAPAFYPYLSGRDNLKILADYCSVPGDRVENVLVETGLSDRADDRTNTYSMGMQQRLGVAASLLKQPSLLILDEPTNGLDPEGIETIYNIMTRYRSSGKSVIFSSHHLHDVVKMCDKVGVFREGKLVADHPVSDFAGPRKFVVDAQPFDLALQVLSSFYGPKAVSVSEDRIRVHLPDLDVNTLTGQLTESGVTLQEFSIASSNSVETLSNLMKGANARGNTREAVV